MILKWVDEDGSEGELDDYDLDDSEALAVLTVRDPYANTTGSAVYVTEDNIDSIIEYLGKLRRGVA